MALRATPNFIPTDTRGNGSVKAHETHGANAGRRRFLKILGAATAAQATLMLDPWTKAFAFPTPTTSDEFFVFIHAAGGWDTMLSLEPRTAVRGLIQPPTEANSDVGGVRLWRPAAGGSFEPVVRGSLRLGPAVGYLADLADRLCVFNGLAMNTVSHDDGSSFAVTGRHLSGGVPGADSIDIALSHAFGTQQLVPGISIGGFPSAFVSPQLDRRSVPVRVGYVGLVTYSLTRSQSFTTAAERRRVTALLAEEAQDLSDRAYFSDAPDRFGLQSRSLQQVLDQDLRQIFDQYYLVRPEVLTPELRELRARVYPYNVSDSYVTNASFVVQALRRNAVRCISLALGEFDTHFGNNRSQPQRQQEFFDTLAALVRALDNQPHPTITGHRLSEHTHILVTSDFCRTPDLNLSQGRDHYPNNAALVISPRFRGGVSFGSSDPEQYLPMPVTGFRGAPRPVAPPDVLATLVSAFGLDPQCFFRDGEVIRSLLR
jgi:hypothetical protein